MEKKAFHKIVSLCKRRGFVWPTSEIYGGVSAIWDFGPLGVLMKRAIKDLWWQKFVTAREDVVGIEGAIIMHPKVWQASGHLEKFFDWMTECNHCKFRLRLDKILNPDEFEIKDREIFVHLKRKIICPLCEKTLDITPEAKSWNVRKFSQMFKTYLGPVEDKASEAYLRPETAQAMFTDFKLVLETTRQKIPFGIAQIGKSFRNEITTGDFFFRSREFEIAELEYFVKPGTDEGVFVEWLDRWERFYLDLGIDQNKLRRFEHPKKSLAHYSKRTVDIEYEFPFGWSELAGVANRTDYDLSEHEKFSGADLHYSNDGRFIPYVVEPTMGIERIMLAALADGFDESDGSDGRAAGEITLHLHPKIAPIKAAVFPLIKKNPLSEIANKIAHNLRQAGISTFYDESGTVGRRYRRQDEIGTPWCITADFESLENETVTLRDRDTMKQERLKSKELIPLILQKLSEN